MKNESNEPQAENLPASPLKTVLDAHGFDPAAYQWLPVLRRPREDGWTPQTQRAFITALADCGCVAQAAREVSMSPKSCYRLRRSPGAENFAAAWDAAMANAGRMLVDIAFERAINGSEEPIFDRDGQRVGRRMRHNDRMMMFLMRAYMPDRFRHAHLSTIQPHEQPPTLPPPVGQALLRLAPAEPDAPHLLMEPDELDDALDMADMLDGQLPPWHREQVAVPAHGAAISDEEQDAFDRAFEEAKNSATARARTEPAHPQGTPFEGALQTGRARAKGVPANRNPCRKAPDE